MLSAADSAEEVGNRAPHSRPNLTEYTNGCALGLFGFFLRRPFMCFWMRWDQLPITSSSFLEHLIALPSNRPRNQSSNVSDKRTQPSRHNCVGRLTLGKHHIIGDLV